MKNKDQFIPLLPEHRALQLERNIFLLQLSCCNKENVWKIAKLRH